MAGLLDRFFSRPGIGEGLGILGAHLMAAGAPTTDPGGAQRAVAEGLRGFLASARQGREDQAMEAYRKAQIGELEAKASERKTKAAQGEAWRQQWSGPQADLVRLAEERGLNPATMQGLLVGMGPEAGGKALLDATKPAAPQRPLSVAPGGTLLDPTTRQPFYTAPERPVTPKAPTTRTIARGNEQVTQEWTPERGWADVGTAPRWQPERPVTPLDRIAAEAEARARGTAAGAPQRTPSSRYQPLGAYVDQDGNFLGEGVFDKQTGQAVLRTDKGDAPIPAGARPRTESALDKNAMSGEQFFKLASTASEEERSLGALARYMKNVQSTEQGLALIADKLIGQYRTIFGGDLTPEQYRTLLQNGQLQRLVGGFRKEVVGGGVMTEQDALRVLAAVGGDISMLRNRDVAIQLLGELFSDKAREYNESIVPTFNTQLKAVPRGPFKPKEPVPIDAQAFSRSPAGAPVVSTDEEYDALPAGAEFLDPQGKRRRKP